jgi:hypothetical protein
MNISLSTRPHAAFYQTTAVACKAAEVLALSTLKQLVLKKVLTAEEALSAFDNLSPLTSGVNNADQVGMTLGHWRDMFKWFLEQGGNAPAESDKAA